MLQRLLRVCSQLSLARPPLYNLLTTTPSATWPPQSFSLQRAKPLPPRLLPYMRLAYATDPQLLEAIQFGDGSAPVQQPVEPAVICALSSYLQAQLDAYAQPLWRDLEVLQDQGASPRQKVGR
jgi:hypothetical protein